MIIFYRTHRYLDDLSSEEFIALHSNTLGNTISNKTSVNNFVA